MRSRHRQRCLEQREASLQERGRGVALEEEVSRLRSERDALSSDLEGAREKLRRAEKGIVAAASGADGAGGSQPGGGGRGGGGGVPSTLPEPERERFLGEICRLRAEVESNGREEADRWIGFERTVNLLVDRMSHYEEGTTRALAASDEASERRLRADGELQDLRSLLKKSQEALRTIKRKGFQEECTSRQMGEERAARLGRVRRVGRNLVSGGITMNSDQEIDAAEGLHDDTQRGEERRHLSELQNFQNNNTGEIQTGATKTGNSFRCE